MKTSETLRILAVDDDPSALALLTRFLRNAGHEVTTASNGKEALAVTLAEGPHMVITDWLMPEMDGLELCRALRNHEGIRYTYIIVLTSIEDAGRIVEALDAGADDYQRKPYRGDELLARVRTGTRTIQLQNSSDRHTREAHRFNAEMSLTNDKLAEVNEKLHRMATTDELTGLLNRREAMARIADCWGASTRHDQPLACMMLDLDHFKSCNDRYGHAFGDLVLRETATILRRETRSGESVFRLGGEEFLILCPCSTETMASAGAERIRTAVQTHSMKFGELQLGVTISIGVAERSQRTESPEKLLRIADAALYEAKRSGRNMVRMGSGMIAEAPAAAGELVPAAQADPHDSRTSKEALTVLLAGGDPSQRAVRRALLEQAGFTAIDATGGNDVLRILKRSLPDVVVLRTRLSDMSGVECVTRIRAESDFHSLPVILAAGLDGSLAPEEVDDCIRCGVDEWVAGFATPAEFVLRVQTLARTRREVVRSNSVRGEQARALELFLNFSQALAAAHCLDDVLEATTTAAGALLCCRRAFILLPNSDDDALYVASAMGLDPNALQSWRSSGDASLVRKALEGNDGLVFQTANQAERNMTEADAVLFPSAPFLCRALGAVQSAVGVIGVSARQDARPFLEIDLEYIGLICNIAGSAIQDWMTRRARDEARDSIVVALAKLAESRDVDTGRHLDRVTHFCRLLATQLQKTDLYREAINAEFLSDLDRAVPLHDIGKVAMPDSVLMKPGSLTDDEMAKMRTHAAIGAATLESVIKRAPGVRFLIMAEEIARAHHEWYNGHGYPDRLCGNEIPLPARIAAVADVYDALTTRRVYKEPMPHCNAVAIIRNASGAQFDPEVVEAFLQCESEFMQLAADLADPPDAMDPQHSAFRSGSNPVSLPAAIDRSWPMARATREE